MTLRDLMSFTSGMTEEDNCMNRADSNFETCALAAASRNVGNGNSPGKLFYYSGSHLQVAGLMTLKARNATLGVNNSTWQNVFAEFKAKTGLFSHSQYDLPSAGNPRLAVGVHWIGNDYVEFLRKYSKGQLISAYYQQKQLSD